MLSFLPLFFQPGSISQMERWILVTGTLGWEEGSGSGFATEISALLNQPEQNESRQKRHLPAVTFLFICFSKGDLPKAGNGFPPPTSCGERVHGGMQSAEPSVLLNMKSPLVAAVLSPLLFDFPDFGVQLSCSETNPLAP